MRPRYEHLVAVTAMLASACGAAPDSAGVTPTPSTPGVTMSVLDVGELGDFDPLPVGTYVIDPDLAASTPLRVVYDVSAEGWSQWIGAVKFAGDGHVGVSITTVTNLVSDGCVDHSWAEPPVGPSVDDLAAALAKLAPFRVTAPPQDVSRYGYSGTYLELTVPDLAVEGQGDDRTFTDCVDGELKSWVGAIDVVPGDAFYGYTGPGYTEEFWILDVDGTRLVIAAERSADSPPESVEEMRAILDSIRIEP